MFPFHAQLGIPDYPYWLPQILNELSNALNLGINWHELGPLVLVLWAVLVFTLIAIVAQAAVIFMVLMERKVLAWLTQRKGPNRVGPWGLLQTLADGVKLLFKEDIVPAGADKLLFWLAPAVFFLPSFVFFGLIPFTDQLLAIALPAGAFFVFAISSISIIGLVLAGWASNNKYSLLGGMRSAAQAISYELPLALAVLGVILFTGSLNLAEIVRAQQGGFWNWFSVVLTPVSAVIFFVAALAELNRVPFDLPEAESELVSGYNTEYTGMKFALFFLAEYASLFAMSALTTAIFFGGYYSPMGPFVVELLSGQAAASMTGLMQLGLQVEMLFWFMMKTYCFIFLAMWIRATLPRLKPDQLMGFSWKFLIPLTVLNIFVVALGKYMLESPLLARGETLMGNLPILHGRTLWTINNTAIPDWGVLLIWAGLAAIIFGAFSYMMSRLLTQKLEARLTRR